MKREELLRSKDYIVTQLQLSLLNLIGDYKDKHHLKDYQLAEQLGVSKGYVSQILNGSFDHKISKVVDLALVCNVMPLLHFIDMNEFIANDARDKVYEAFPVQRPQNIVFEQQITASHEIATDVFRPSSQYSTNSFTTSSVASTPLKSVQSQS